MRRLFGRDARAGLVAGVSSAYGNTLLVGIPLVLTAYGNEGAAAISLLIALHLPVLMTASAILIERALVTDGLSADADAKAIAASLVGALVKNPIIIGLALGLLWRLTGLPIAGPGGRGADPHRRRRLDAGADLGRHDAPPLRHLAQRPPGARGRLHQAGGDAGDGLRARRVRDPAAAVAGRGRSSSRRRVRPASTPTSSPTASAPARRSPRTRSR